MGAMFITRDEAAAILGITPLHLGRNAEVYGLKVCRIKQKGFYLRAEVERLKKEREEHERK